MFRRMTNKLAGILRIFLGRFRTGSIFNGRIRILSKMDRICRNWAQGQYSKSTIVELRYLSIAILTEDCSGYFCTGTCLAPGHRKNVQYRLFLTARAFLTTTDTVANWEPGILVISYHDGYKMINTPLPPPHTHTHSSLRSDSITWCCLEGKLRRGKMFRKKVREKRVNVGGGGGSIFRLSSRLNILWSVNHHKKFLCKTINGLNYGTVAIHSPFQHIIGCKSERFSLKIVQN